MSFIAPLLIAIVLIGQAPRAGQSTGATDPWITRPTPREVEGVAYADPSGRFSLDYPKKDWRVVGAGYASLVTIAHKDAEASIVLERQDLGRPLSAAAIGDLFVQLQTEELRKLDPLAQDIASRLLDAGGVRIPAFEYVRRRSDRDADYVRMYLMPRGSALYRLVCRVDSTKLKKHAAVFALVASSLTFKETS